MRPVFLATTCHVCMRQVRAVGLEGDSALKVEQHGDYSQPDKRSPSGRMIRPTCEGSGRLIAVPTK